MTPLETPDAWHALASRRDPLSVTSLLTGRFGPRSLTLRKMLGALAGFPADPRIARFGEQMAANLRHPGMGRLREKALELVEELQVIAPTFSSPCLRTSR